MDIREATNKDHTCTEPVEATADWLHVLGSELVAHIAARLHEDASLQALKESCSAVNCALSRSYIRTLRWRWNGEPRRARKAGWRHAPVPAGQEEEDACSWLKAYAAGAASVAELASEDWEDKRSVPDWAPVAHHAPHVRHLVVSVPRNDRAPFYAPSLRRLVPISLTDSGQQLLSTAFSHLRTLDIGFVSPQGPDMLAQLPSMPGLRVLAAPQKMGEHSVRALPRICPNLAHLSLPKLDHVWVTEPNEIDTVMQALSALPFLRTLELNDAGGHEMPAPPAPMLNLRHLWMCHCKEMRVLPPLGSFPNLVTLNLTHCSAIKPGDRTASVYPNCAPALQHICLYGASAMDTISDVPTLLAAAPSLVTLDVRACASFRSREDLRAATVEHPHLQVLDARMSSLLAAWPDAEAIALLVDEPFEQGDDPCLPGDNEPQRPPGDYIRASLAEGDGHPWITNEVAGPWLQAEEAEDGLQLSRPTSADGAYTSSDGGLDTHDTHS